MKKDEVRRAAGEEDEELAVNYSDRGKEDRRKEKENDGEARSAETTGPLLAFALCMRACVASRGSSSCQRAPTQQKGDQTARRGAQSDRTAHKKTVT